MFDKLFEILASFCFEKDDNPFKSAWNFAILYPPIVFCVLFPLYFVIGFLSVLFTGQSPEGIPLEDLFKGYLYFMFGSSIFGFIAFFTKEKR